MTKIATIPKRILFIPVSSPSGIGEYARSMIIAKALLDCWPKCEIHFILNNKVNYLADCPYHVHTCQGSATKDSATVNKVITTLQPDLVIFDAAGRAKQFKQAKQVGAKVVFISQHSKKRARGLKLNRLFYTDMHWVVQPDFCIQELSWWQQAKLAVFSKVIPKNIGPVFDLPSTETQTKILTQFDLEEQSFFLFNAGSGGHQVSGTLAADTYYQAAQLFHQQTKVKVIMVFGSNYPKSLPSKSSGVICLSNIDNESYMALLIAAQGRVISAGDTLLQAISLHKPCVAAAVSSDQPARLKRCNDEKLVLCASPTADSLVQQAILLVPVQGDNAISLTLEKNMAKLAPQRGLKTILDDFMLLFGSATRQEKQ